MFLFRAGRYLEELKKFRPDILAACEQAMRGVDPDLDFIRVDEEAFLACPEESIDYAVMERTADAVVMPMDAGWSDVGSWSSLWEISAHTPGGNVHHGDVISHKTENSYVYAESGPVTTVGVKDLVVVQTKDAVLIADRHAVQDVKKVVEKIKADGRHEHHMHREVYRPWGKYDSIDAGERYQVKRITVKPGKDCRCRCTITAPSTGWWWRGPPESPSTARLSCSVKTSPSIFRWGRPTARKSGKYR